MCRRTAQGRSDVRVHDIRARLPTRFRENLRKAIAAGLPTDAALAALTLDAAEILGVAPQIGSVTKGRAAHLVVCDGDFDAAKTKYKFAFADGMRFDLDETGRPATRLGASEAPTPLRRVRAANKARITRTNPRRRRRAPPGPRPQRHGPTAGRSITPSLRRRIPRRHPDARRGRSSSPRSKRIESQVKTGGNVLIRDATVLTLAGKTLPKADILVRGGKIRPSAPT